MTKPMSTATSKHATEYQGNMLQQKWEKSKVKQIKTKPCIIYKISSSCTPPPDGYATQYSVADQSPFRYCPCTVARMAAVTAHVKNNDPL